MKKNLPFYLCCLSVILISSLNIQIPQAFAKPLLNKTYHNLSSGSFLQDWSNKDLITKDDDWTGVNNIEGFRGDGLTNSDGTDPQTILQDDNPGIVDVNANKFNPNSFSTGGVTEFDSYENNVILSIALSGSGIADAPYIKININSTNCSEIRMKYNVKDLDGSIDNAMQQVAAQFRVGGSGNFINVPEAYIPDATTGPNLATKVTPVDVTLPASANDNALLEIRIMTSDAVGNDEWIGIDDIEISGNCVDPYAEPIVPDCPEKITTYEGVPINASFSASDLDGQVIHATILNDPIFGIELNEVQPAQEKGLALTGQLLIGDITPGGNHEVQLQFTNNDPIPQTNSCTIPIHVIPQSCLKTDTHQIGEIQGEGLITPYYNNSGITISGMVTATFFEGGINGFYVQDPDGDENALTSDGIFIKSTDFPLSVGQPVQITGTVIENFSRTEIINVTHLELCGSPSIISPISLAMPLNRPTDFEKYEGMHVKFPQELTIIDHHNFTHYGELILGSQRHINPTSLYQPGTSDYEYLSNLNLLDQIILDDSRSTFNPSPSIHPNGINLSLGNLFRCGDKLKNVTGIMDYAFGNYRIQPSKGAEYANANQRPSDSEFLAGNIKVASFNVLNFFTTLNSRGAENETEFIRQKDKLIAAIKKLDADILGLVEIENNENALQNLVEGLNEAIGEDAYQFIDTGIIGLDQIRVAIIYKSGKVNPVGNFAILDSSIDARFIDNKNRPVLAQTFSDLLNNKKFTVVVNHFKSRSTACDDINDPDLNDGSGNCNLTRKSASEALVDWLASDPTGSESNNFLIIGDLNSYRKEEPILEILSGADHEISTIDDYADLIYQFYGDNAYTYVYDGQVGYLDHALASPFLSQRVTTTSIWHINADEPDLLDYHLESKDLELYRPDEYRSSDHDPVIIGLDFSENLPPIVESYINFNGKEDESIEIILDALDEYNHLLTFQIIDNPTNGSLQLSENIVVYNPFPNYSGLDSFTFVANNSFGNSNLGTVTLNIQSLNDHPIAQNDFYEIEQNQTLQLVAPGVLANDSDVDNDPLTLILVSSTNNGTLILNMDGSFSFEPAKDFHGELEFSYKAYDGQEYSASAIVKIKVKPVESYPNHIIYLPFIIR